MIFFEKEMRRGNDSEQRRGVFARIYAERLWGSGDDPMPSVSGRGSGENGTRGVRAALPGLVRQLGVRSIADVPCGDFAWLSRLALDVVYVGGDIVPALIEENLRIHSRPGVEFVVIDLVSDSLPCADLFLCRDALVHLSNTDVLSALSNIRRSGSTYLFATTYPRVENRDIAIGDWRPVDLTAAPFALPPPMLLVSDPDAAGEDYADDKHLGLWRLLDLDMARH